MNATRRFTGGHMLAIMILFFGTVIAVNISMAILASSSWTGLVAKNGYVASIDFANAENARKAAEARGWTVALTADDGFVRLDARDDLGRPLEVTGAATVTAVPDDGEPFSLPLLREGDILVGAERLPAGRWAVTVEVGNEVDAISWRVVSDVNE